MAADDYAIVVGVSRYPELGDLGGPENDARAFRDWLLDATGGDLPEANVRAFLSSDYGLATMGAVDAHPSAADVEQAFDVLADLSAKNNAALKGMRVGRRLYIFLAGHGFAPQLDDSALLTANATPLRPGYHIPGRPYANWFVKAGLFDEVLLFMDCCRESYPRAPIRVLPYVDMGDPDAFEAARTFFAFATKWSRTAREKQLPPDEKWRGIFSATLLNGLRGAACEPGSSDVTARSLGDYLYGSMKTLLSNDELNDPNVPKEPQVFYDPNPASRFVIAKAPRPLEVNVVVDVGAVGEGKAAEIATTDRTVNQVPAAPRKWGVSLAKGLYVARIQEQKREVAFEVKGDEGQKEGRDGLLITIP